MAKEIVFLKETKINSATYEKDKSLKVSDELAKKLVDDGSAKEKKATTKA
jgi:hypothetical protein